MPLQRMNGSTSSLPSPDPLAPYRKRLSLLDKKLQDPSLPPELRAKVQAARNVQAAALRLREKASKPNL